MNRNKIAVLGAGSWGTALAMQAAKNFKKVSLWAHRFEHYENLRQDRENCRYLPGYLFPDNLEMTHDLEYTLKDADLCLLVVPSSVFGQLLDSIKKYTSDIPIIWAMKGFEHGTGRLLSDVFVEKFGSKHPHALLAGPSFAKETAAGKTTAVCIASSVDSDARFFAEAFHSDNFICYTSNDIVGAQIGGAVKNVIAIAVGISDGINEGANTRAALITRGLHETTRLATNLGALPETLFGLAGMGDLLLTATDNQSRNRRFGLALGQGKTIEEARAEIAQIIEGEGASHDTWTLAEKLSIRMPITEHVHLLLSGQITVAEAAKSLSHRMIKNEVI